MNKVASLLTTQFLLFLKCTAKVNATTQFITVLRKIIFNGQPAPRFKNYKYCLCITTDLHLHVFSTDPRV